MNQQKNPHCVLYLLKFLYLYLHWSILLSIDGMCHQIHSMCVTTDDKENKEKLLF